MRTSFIWVLLGSATFAFFYEYDKERGWSGMFERVHSFVQQVKAWLVSLYEGDQVLALVCLFIGMVAILLWIWLKKWEWQRQHIPVMARAGHPDTPEEFDLPGDSCRAEIPGGLSECLVLEWEVCKSPEGIGDIGDLEQKLTKLQKLRLDSAYNIIVFLSSDYGVLSPKVAEILGRRFPGYMFIGRGEKAV
jgi:hypothetical protein